MTYDKPIVIQKRDEATEQWSNLWSLHARVNKTVGSEFVQGGANQSESTKTFEVRYFTALQDVDYNRGLYRIVYKGVNYNIVDYDDYMERHKAVTLEGVSYGA